MGKGVREKVFDFYIPRIFVFIEFFFDEFSLHTSKSSRAELYFWEFSHKTSHLFVLKL